MISVVLCYILCSVLYSVSCVIFCVLCYILCFVLNSVYAVCCHLVLLAVLLCLLQLLLQTLEEGVSALLTQGMVHTGVVTQHVEQGRGHLQPVGHGTGLATLTHQGEPIPIHTLAQYCYNLHHSLDKLPPVTLYGTLY